MMEGSNGEERLGDASVGGDDENGRHVGLEGPVEVREALNVQHVHLVNEEHLSRWW